MIKTFDKSLGGNATQEFLKNRKFFDNETFKLLKIRDISLDTWKTSLYASTTACCNYNVNL